MNAKVLNVCHLTPTYFSEDSVVGGGERYVYNLVEAVREANRTAEIKINQSVISISDNSGTITRDGVVIQLLNNISPTPGNMNYIPNQLWKHLEGLDVLHIHQGLTQFGEYCAVVAASLGIPFVITDLGGGSSNLMLSGKGLELANRVIAISKYANSLTSTSYSGETSVLIGPVDTEYFSPCEAQNRFKKYGICVSRILPHKGIDRIISALPYELELKVVGKVYDQDYFDLLRRLSEGKKVDFVQDAGDEELLALYQGADIFLQGSTHKDIYGNIIQKPELMGLTTLEAMSCGLPVIVSDAGSLPEMVPNDRVGRVFSNHADLSKIFDEYMSGKWPLEDARLEARNHVVDNYSFLTVGKSLSAIYKEVFGL
ncbi:glycosyltransferase family 4 protein [Kluyvera genomosp. 2]|uniref:glycosyltransferase family 4 protein n=1 Tax=Kluyvera genomosp. 2 TaxID=2774054 RepID=UPI002FD83449